MGRGPNRKRATHLESDASPASLFSAGALPASAPPRSPRSGFAFSEPGRGFGLSYNCNFYSGILTSRRLFPARGFAKRRLIRIIAARFFKPPAAPLEDFEDRGALNENESHV